MFLIKRQQGLSLVETMIIMSIVIILAAIALPSFLSFMQRYRLITTSQHLYYNLQYARSVALKKSQTVYVAFQTGSNWCYGIGTSSACDCSNPSSCDLGSFTPPNQLTTLSLSGFNALTFEGTRGTASATGTITLTVTGDTPSMGVDVGTVGNLLLCSTNVSGYPTC